MIKGQKEQLECLLLLCVRKHVKEKILDLEYCEEVKKFVEK